jgi:hypothetical protein
LSPRPCQIIRGRGREGFVRVEGMAEAEAELRKRRVGTERCIGRCIFRALGIIRE